MSQRYEAIAARRYKDQQGNEKTKFTNIGVAWPMRDKDSFTLRLDAIPAPQDGEYVILLMPPKPKDGDRQQRNEQPSHGGGLARDIDDDIPFAPEWRG